MGKTISNLIESKQFADELRLRNSVINSSQQAIYISDNNNQIIRYNPACEQMTGYTADELRGQSPKVFQSHYHSKEFYSKLWLEAAETDFWQGELWNKAKNGTVFAQWLTISVVKDIDARIERYIVIFSDLTAIKKAEKDIQQLSFFDPLTQLPNRTLFIDRVKQVIAQSKKKGNKFALFCLDIDHFKQVNESFGHEEGDKFLLAAYLMP